MKIHSGYQKLITQTKTNLQVNQEQQEGASGVRGEPGDRQQLSRLLTRIRQELARLEEEPAPEQAAKLQQLSEQVASNSYRVDPFKIAGAMLKISAGDENEG